MIAITHLPSPRMQACEVTFVPRRPIDYSQALAQHASYCQALAGCRCTVRRLDANLALADCAFIEDTAIVLDEGAILASMGAASRRDETAAVEAVLREYRGVERVDLPATLEGGDVLQVGRTLLVGQSGRTNSAGIEALAQIAGRWGYRVVTVPVRGCLHLKTACTALPDGRLLLNREWIDPAAVVDFGIVEVPAGEPWGANMIRLGDSMLLAAAHVQTAQLVRRLGFAVRTVELTEFAKAEGGATCLALLVA